MADDRVLFLGRRPNSPARSLLLEMQFLHGKKIHRGAFSDFCSEFFRRLLLHRIGWGHDGAWLAEPESIWRNQRLELPNSQWTPTRSFHRAHGRSTPRRSALRAVPIDSVGQSAQSTSLETMLVVLDRTWSVAPQSHDFLAADALRHKTCRRDRDRSTIRGGGLRFRGDHVERYLAVSAITA